MLINILTTIIALLLYGVLTFLEIHARTVNLIKTKAIEAETLIDSTKDVSGEDKMNIVVASITKYIPFVLKFAFGEKKIRTIAQETYDSLKEFWEQREVRDFVCDKVKQLEGDNADIVEAVTDVIQSVSNGTHEINSLSFSNIEDI